jgi:hypothetical protein
VIGKLLVWLNYSLLDQFHEGHFCVSLVGLYPDLHL